MSSFLSEENSLHLLLPGEGFLIADLSIISHLFTNKDTRMTEGCRPHHHHHHHQIAMGVEDPWFHYGQPIMKKNNEFGDDHDHGKQSSTSSTYTSSIGEDSSLDSVCSSDTTDDATSSPPSSISNSSYDLSALMVQLPIKRGLSKFYQGKSESFTSLSRVTSTEDLAKKAAPYMRRKLKASKSCGKLNSTTTSYKAYTLPRAVISKRTTTATRIPSFSSFPFKRGSLSLTQQQQSPP